MKRSFAVRWIQPLCVVALCAVPFTTFGAKLPVEVAEFVFERAPFTSCHASTVLEMPDGELLSAWFGGPGESRKGTGIWLSRKPVAGVWSVPEQIVGFRQTACWNPVLFRDRKGKVRLYFKVGPDERSWVGAYRISSDGGKTWSSITYLPAGLYGPVRSKPVYLADGTLLAGSSEEAGMRRDEEVEQPFWAWTAWMERSTDDGDTWQRFGPILFPGKNYGLIQPTVWEGRPGQIVALLRSPSSIGTICKAVSGDSGKNWSPAIATSLPNPDSGIDAVKLADGRIALVYNHSRRDRSPLNLTVSRNGGETWGPPHALEDQPGEFSYPAMIQGRDGRLHITYTWKRKRIKYLRVDPATVTE